MKRNHPRRALIWTTASLLSLAASLAAKPPNFVLILCDNLGYGDVGCFNPDTKNRTLHIDRMATEGKSFTHAYAPAPVCTPSRAGLLTGCYPRRVGLDHTPDGVVLRPVSRFGLHPEETTIAEVLKTRGYATACIGKWHLGDQDPFLPTRQGFDLYYGIPYSDDMVPRDGKPTPPLPLMDGEKVVEAPADRNTLTKRYTERAVDFLETNREKPFFLYLPQAMPGSTRKPFASDAFRGKSANGPWGDSVEELDWSMGEILAALKRLGLEENTLVIWTNDNGAPAGRGGTGLPLKGNAYNISEGGMRVPFIARWPGKVPARTTSTEMITLMDFYPTFANLAGAKLPGKVDGHNIAPLLFGKAASPYNAFYYYYLSQLQAVRSGPWKLYLPLQEKWASFGRKKVAAQGQLFNLIEDPKETKNLFATKPKVVEQLTDFAEQARVDLGDEDRKGPGVRALGRFENPKPRIP